MDRKNRMQVYNENGDLCTDIFSVSAPKVPEPENPEVLRRAKKAAKKAAKELYYPPEVAEQIDKATKQSEITRILSNARRNKYKDQY